MTRQKHLKDRVRARMQKTGESYSVARRHILAKATPGSTAGPERFHYPGNVPGTTALRVLLSAARVKPLGRSDPLSEAMLFGIAGGVGAGVFSFRYEQEDFSSFFIAGRHLWQDDDAYLQSALARLGAKVEVKETGGAKTAARQLRDALDEGGPVVAWVDLHGLPRHVAPQDANSGGHYHVVTVYGIDETKSEVIIGDRADVPDRVPLDVFAQARSRIAKQKNRLLRIDDVTGAVDPGRAVIDGVAACHDALIGKGAVKAPGGKAMAKKFTLDAFREWAERLHGSSDKQSWSRIFPRGLHFWRGLTSVYSSIHYGTGGGLTRPLYAQFFREACQIHGNKFLQELAQRYEQLGRDWDDLGEAALPDDVTLFRRYRELSVQRAELTLSGGQQAADRIRELLSELAELERSAAEAFPLSENECDELRANLKRRVSALHADEIAAHQRLGEFLAATA